MAALMKMTDAVINISTSAQVAFVTKTIGQQCGTAFRIIKLDYNKS